jgi:hypothetical protein
VSAVGRSNKLPMTASRSGVQRYGSTASILMNSAKRSASAFVRSFGMLPNVTTTPGLTGREEWYVPGRAVIVGSRPENASSSPVISAAFPFLRELVLVRVLTVKFAGSARQLRNRLMARCRRRAYYFNDDGLKSLARLLLKRLMTASKS